MIPRRKCEAEQQTWGWLRSLGTRLVVERRFPAPLCISICRDQLGTQSKVEDMVIESCQVEDRDAGKM